MVRPWLLSACLLLGCGRIGYELQQGPARAEGTHGKDPFGPSHQLDASTPSVGVGSDASLSDAGFTAGDARTARDATLPTYDGAAGDAETSPLCGVCGPGASCIGSSCVSECEGRYRSAIDCHNFEAGLTDLAYSAGVSAATDQARSGTTSVRAEASGSGVSAELIVPVSPTQTSGTLYFRAYYYIATPPTDGLIKLLGLHSGVDENVDININPDRSFDFYFHEMPAGARVQGTPGHAQFNRWMCLQVALELSDTLGSLTVSVDGQLELASAQDRDTSTPNGIDEASVGIVWSEASTSTVVYVDDVVLDTAPIPCQ